MLWKVTMDEITEQAKPIEIPPSIQIIFPSFTGWTYEVGAILKSDYDGVTAEFFNFFNSAESLHDVFENIRARQQDLVSYRFYCSNMIPAFTTYADGLVHSKASPRKYFERKRLQGAAPWDYKSNDTIFEIYNDRKNIYFGETMLRLKCGGRDKNDSKNKFLELRKVLHQNFVNPEG